MKHYSARLRWQFLNEVFFLRNAEGSRVCSLYDEMALSRIINDGMHHPLSREPITLSMLVAREQCEFDCSIGHFTVRSDCYSV
ncbi:T3SS effector NleG family protein [Escherichia coli]|uniref:T3SS effector NleG family protein n=1 Tax=Escherichia coli TaxID=562 RepID=UPI0032DF2052